LDGPGLRVRTGGGRVPARSRNSRGPPRSRRLLSRHLRGGVVGRRRLVLPEEERGRLNFTVYVALLGWPLVAICLCAILPPRRAVITAFIAAWLFLPMASFPIPGLPDWTKMSATAISLLL